MIDELLETQTDNSDYASIADAVAGAAKEAQRLANKPVIDHLPDVVVGHGAERQFMAARHEKIIVERVASILDGSPWLDTKVYTVVSIDGVSGNVTLHDDEAEHNVMVNYFLGPERGYKFKFPPKKGNTSLAKKRGRPRKDKVVGGSEPVKPVELDANGQPVKKKRGRPKGTKNRDKDVIKAEKAARAAEKKAAKASRK